MPRTIATALLALLPALTALGCGGQSETNSDGPRIYWGAEIGEHLTGAQAPWDLEAIDAFERLAGKEVSLVHFAAPFASCPDEHCWYYRFPTRPMDNTRFHGAIPFLSWASQSIDQGGHPAVQPDFQLADIAAGDYDSHIREFADEAREWGHPFFLRFNFEMNGDWFPWAERTNGNRRGDFVAAWRHVHDIFTSVGADNATWVWCPYADPDGRLQGLRPLYPGDAYVDWTCLDGYNWGTNPAAPRALGGAPGWREFDEIFASTYRQITRRLAPSKPMVIGELGSTGHGGSKAAWIEDALRDLRGRYPRIRGILWFETFIDGMDWPLAASGEAAAAFAKVIDEPAYAGRAYGDLSAEPIPPPG